MIQRAPPAPVRTRFSGQPLPLPSLPRLPAVGSFPACRQDGLEAQRPNFGVVTSRRLRSGIRSYARSVLIVRPLFNFR